MSKTALSVGSQIEVRCPSCRKNRDHEILSMKNGHADKVQCMLCKHQRKYRPPAALMTAEEKLLIKDTKTRQNQNAMQRKQWETLNKSMDHSKALNYSMTETYKSKALIDHPVFGFGQVRRVLGSQKVEILFEDGVKIMRCK